MPQILHLSEASREVDQQPLSGNATNTLRQPPPSQILHLSEAKGEVGRQLVVGPEGAGEAVLDLVNGSVNPRAAGGGLTLVSLGRFA